MTVDIPKYSPEMPTKQVIPKKHTSTHGKHINAVGENLKSK